MPFFTNSLAAENGSRPANRSLSEMHLAGANWGREEWFESLCRTLAPRLHKIAFRITQNAEDAEDAVQDALLSAFVHIKDFHGNSAFSTWLIRIVMNSALMIRRKNRSARKFSSDEVWMGDRPLHFQIPDRSPNPEQTYARRERETVLRQAVRKLRPKMRLVIELAQFQELPLKEAANVLDISVAAAKGRFFHARAALRRSAALRAVAQARKEPAA